MLVALAKQVEQKLIAVGVFARLPPPALPPSPTLYALLWLQGCHPRTCSKSFLSSISSNFSLTYE